jgi:hypothetical protein
MLYLASFIIIVLAIAGMAIGVIFGRPAIKGSCGGLAGECPRCTVKCRRREGST